MIKTAHRNKIPRYLFTSLFVALMLSVFLPGTPVMAAPVLELLPASGPIGVTVTVTGTVFDSYEGDSIRIFFDTAEIDNSPIVVPSGGAFTVTFTVPDTADAGGHTIGAKKDALLISSAVFTVEEPEITLNVSEGAVGTNVVISGSYFYPGKKATLYYYNDSNETIGTVTASSSGGFTQKFTIPAGSAGSHRFTAYDSYDNSARATFKVLPAITLSEDSAPAGDTLTVRGTGFRDTATVTISLDNSAVASAVTDDYGSFEVSFIIPEITPQAYDLKARDNSGNTKIAEFIVSAGFHLSADTGPVGGLLTVSGSGFDPGSAVTVFYDGKEIAAADADNNSNFSITFTVPASSGGKHIITVSGVSKAAGDVPSAPVSHDYTFTVETIAPPAPALLVPQHNGITGAANTYFQWQAVADISLPITYDLQISADRNFSDIILAKTALNGSEYTLNGNETLKADSINSLFFWRVQAIDAAGNRSAWSETYSFYIDIPKAPAILLPANEADADYPVRFSWEAVSGLSRPITYNFQISRNIEFSELLFDEKDLASADFVVTEENKRLFKNSTPYYWRVKAIDAARNTSDWSDVGSFNIISHGFPAWATITLISLAAVVLILLAYRYGRRAAYQKQ